MADAFTTSASVDFDQDAYDRMTYFSFRPELYFDRAADVKPTHQAMPGKGVIFTITNDLAVASTPLNESVDVDAVALSDSQITVVLQEYGNAVIDTALLRGTSFIPLDPVVANVIGYNAGVSLDTIARDVISGGTNVDYAPGPSGPQPTSRNTVTPANTLNAHMIRLERARLRANNVPTFNGAYVCYINPDCVLDLREETGLAAWVAPHVYSQPGEIWNGELGMYEQVRFIETPRAIIFPDAGSSTTLTDVYRTLFLGRQSLAKAYSATEGGGATPKVVPGPVVDKLRRFVPMGWYWLGGYNIFRQASIRAVESASSIGANTTVGSDALPIDA